MAAGPPRSVFTLRTAVVLVCALLAVGAAIVAVGRLQTEATAGRDAELELIALRLDLDQIQDVPWGASPDEGDDPEDVRFELADMEDRIEGSLARLGRSGGLMDVRAIAAPFERSMVALWEVFDLVSHGRSGATDKASSLAAHQAAASDEALQKAAGRYHDRSTRALAQARVWSASLIVILFGAFAWSYARVARARRNAERLTAENRELLTVSQTEAITDALTGLRNRRALMADLDVAKLTADRNPLMLALFDLDGFKQYNDSFGHPAGDALLARLGERLAATIEGIGTAYRMGGDEFCVVASVADGGAGAIAGLAAAALSDEGEGFTIGCSYGVALMPADAIAPDMALQLADQRMYQHKTSDRVSATRQSAAVLLQLIAERSTALEQHTTDVADLAEVTAVRLGVGVEETERIRLAAELHDVGKAAIPDAILNNPGPLPEDEWEFIRGHTVIGERIVRAAPALAHTADLVRWHHERHDGSGYPDGLSGEEIPLGARIIAVSDAFDAMIADRPYRAGISIEAAVDELRRCAGTQFEPAVVDAFVAVLAGGVRCPELDSNQRPTP